MKTEVILEGGIEYDVLGFVPYMRVPMEKYRIRILIDRMDKPGTDTAEIHVGNVSTTSITPLVELARRLTDDFGKLDEVAK